MNIAAYLIQSIIDGSYYDGISRDPIKRLREHNSGKLKITSKKRPYKLVYFKEHKSYKD